MVLDAVQGERVRDLCRRHGVLEILFIGKDENDGVLEVAVLEQSEELFFHDRDSSTVRAIYHYDDRVGPAVVCRP